MTIKKYFKVRDHCHYTGKYRGANICNLRYKTSSSLSSLADNIFESLHSDKCTDCKSCLDYIMFKHDQLIFRCL